MSNLRDYLDGYRSIISYFDDYELKPNFDRFLLYTNFTMDVNGLSNNIFGKILQSNNKRVIKHVINHFVYLDINEYNVCEYVFFNNYNTFFITKLMLKYHMQIDVKYNGKYLIHYACISNNIQLVKYLDEMGADLEAATTIGDQPIHLSMHADTVILKYLILRNVNLESSGQHGFKPIHDACTPYNTHIFKILMDNNVNLESLDKNGNTPIHQACRTNSVKIVEILIHKGVDFNRRNFFGRKPIYIACTNMSYRVIKFFANHNLISDSDIVEIKNIPHTYLMPNIHKQIMDMIMGPIGSVESVGSVGSMESVGAVGSVGSVGTVESVGSMGTISTEPVISPHESILLPSEPKLLPAISPTTKQSANIDCKCEIF